MSHWRQVWLVATWEFGRYFKWRDQLLGLLLFVTMSGVAWGISKMFGASRREMTVATAGIELSAPPGSRLRFVAAPADDAARDTLLAGGTVSGVLTRAPDGAFELRVAKEPRYLPELRAIVANVVRRERLAAAGFDEEALARILSPPEVSVRFKDASSADAGRPADRQRTGRAERIVAAIVLGVVLLAVFTSMAYLLTGIAGEKQLRVTESIISIVRPQAWIDGKILGIGAYALVGVLNMVAGGILLALAARFAWDFRIPEVIVRPGVIGLLLVFGVLTLLLWNAMFAAFAATIDDPNTSARTSMMFLPFLPVTMTIVVLRDPDDLVARVLAVFPLTSPSAMPMRVILSDPGPFEIGVALLLLAGVIWLVRRLAGRVFEIGMLMYGKEPTFREMWRWATAREADPAV